jgi:hypothetical protein
VRIALAQQYFCIKEDVPVGRDEMRQGYEFAKDQYVCFLARGAQGLEEVGTHAADITEFVPIAANRSGLLRQGLLLLRPTRAAPNLRAVCQGTARIQALCARTLGGARQEIHRHDPSG